MLHEPLRAVGRQSTFLHAVQHGGVSCMGVTNPSLALSGHARQFRAETMCSAKRGKGKGVRGPLPHGGWGRVLDFILTHVLIALTMSAARSRAFKVGLFGTGLRAVEHLLSEVVWSGPGSGLAGV